MTSDGGLLAYRDLDDALGLFDSVSEYITDKRTGRNTQHAISTLLRQSVYSRLAGYEDVNDAERLPGGKRLFVLAYNLGNFLRRLVLPKKIKHWSLHSLLVKFIKIETKPSQVLIVAM